jgi:T-complex protein 11
MADMYWQMVLHECEMLLGPSKWKHGGMFSLTPRKLPILFSTMRDILLTLVPKTDRVDVESILDPPLLMQQLRHNVLDFKGLSLWLAAVLKAHCAPMRDQWVEQMVAKVAYGVDNGKISALVEGIQMVFGILEAMKLVSFLKLLKLPDSILICFTGCREPPDPNTSTSLDIYCHQF